jgi:predicted nucleic acid-binding protein
MPQIADSGFLVAYFDEDDVHNGWARALTLRLPLLTCAPVLTETSHLIGTAEPLLNMLLEGDLRVEFDITLHARYLLLWLRKFSDLKPDFADACIVTLADFTPRSEILTTDRRDFSAYRTLAGKPLNCIFPPVK